MSANITDGCLGCGYCNIGCAYGAKQSMLDSVLPWAQRDFPGRVDVLADVRVEQVLHERGRASGVRARGAASGWTVEADEVVVAAGAVGSSWLLQRSGHRRRRAPARSCTSTSTRR